VVRGALLCDTAESAEQKKKDVQHEKGKRGYRKGGEYVFNPILKKGREEGKKQEGRTKPAAEIAPADRP